MAGSRFILPYQQFLQSTGLPYPGGQLFFYLSGTSTPTPTYSDSALTIPNTNPVILDSAGSYGNIFLNPGVTYKVVLEDANSVAHSMVIFTADPVTPVAPSTLTGLIWAGVSTGSANAQIVSAPGFSGQPGQAVVFVAGFANTGPATLNAGTGAFSIYQPGPTSPILLAGAELDAGAAYVALWVPQLNAGAGAFQLVAPFSLAALGIINPIYPPQGRLTLVSATPVMTATTTAATSVLYTPYIGSQIPVWNGTAFIMATFTELTNVLANSSTGKAGPAAAAANSNYDLFVWSNAGVPTLTRGPPWATGGGSNTVRGTGAGSTALNLTFGVYTNAFAVTNGPGAGLGTYVGTVTTDSGGGTVTWNRGAAASGGTAALLGVWNMYNRVSVNALVTDNGAGYTTLGASLRQARASTGNQINFVTGLAEESIYANYSASFNVANPTSVSSGIGLDSTTVSTTTTGNFGFNIAAGSVQPSVISAGTIAPVLGIHFIAALESSSSAPNTGDNNSTNQLSALFKM